MLPERSSSVDRSALDDPLGRLAGDGDIPKIEIFA
jgi:hypothetical protein